MFDWKSFENSRIFDRKYRVVTMFWRRCQLNAPRISRKFLNTQVYSLIFKISMYVVTTSRIGRPFMTTHTPNLLMALKHSLSECTTYRTVGFTFDVTLERNFPSTSILDVDLLWPMIPNDVGWLLQCPSNYTPKYDCAASLHISIGIANQFCSGDCERVRRRREGEKDGNRNAGLLSGGMLCQKQIKYKCELQPVDL